MPQRMRAELPRRRRGAGAAGQPPDEAVDTDPSSGAELDASAGQAIASRAEASHRPSIRWYARLIKASSLSLYYSDGRSDEQTLRQGLIRTIIDLERTCRDGNAFMDQALPEEGPEASTARTSYKVT
ncbi:hypothetical protein Asp14428_33540 [Actinoplanes sp. NBRC 14428]|nr:hypothetical protein Asp14428_33540 [Actinoplanes sp. NBRC 14428]